MSEKLLRLSEAAEILGLGVSTVRELCASKIIRNVRPTPKGTHYRIPESALQEFVASRETMAEKGTQPRVDLPKHRPAVREYNALKSIGVKFG